MRSKLSNVWNSSLLSICNLYAMKTFSFLKNSFLWEKEIPYHHDEQEWLNFSNRFRERMAWWLQKYNGTCNMWLISWTPIFYIWVFFFFYLFFFFFFWVKEEIRIFNGSVGLSWVVVKTWAIILWKKKIQHINYLIAIINVKLWKKKKKSICWCDLWRN